MTHESARTSPEVSPTVEARLQAVEAQVHALQMALRQARALFHDAPQAALLVNAQGRIVETNAQATALFGSTAALLQGRPLLNLFPPTAHSACTALLERVFHHRSPEGAELQLVGAGGQVLEVLVAAALHPSEGQEPLCQLMLTDVTAFKAAHQVLLDATQAQERDIQLLTVKLRQLGEEFRNVMLLSEGELSTTLTRAQNFLTLYERQSDLDERRRSLRNVTTAVQQTQGLLDSLKQYMQARTIRARPQHVNLNRVIREVLKDTADLRLDRDVQVSHMPLPSVVGDSRVLHIILHEYVANALKFTRVRSQARLHVLVKETDTEHWTGVEDNGVGFNMRQKEQVFDLFSRLHPSELYEGTGLGLAVVRSLCERFGGRAWAEGKVNQGATFWLAWPKTPHSDGITGVS